MIFRKYLHFLNCLWIGLNSGKVIHFRSHLAAGQARPLNDVALLVFENIREPVPTLSENGRLQGMGSLARLGPAANHSI